MDMAECTVTVDAQGVYHVNFYQDATVTLDGVTFTICGGYPVNGNVTVTVSGEPKKVVFRKPSWCCKLDIQTSQTSPTSQTFALSLDMNPRFERVAQMPNPQDAEGLAVTDKWALNRYGVAWQDDVNKNIRDAYRKTPALTVWNGPLLLAKSRKLGMKGADFMKTDMKEDVVCVPVLDRLEDDATMGAWILRLAVPGCPVREYRVCDYQSAADGELAGDWFSIWF